MKVAIYARVSTEDQSYQQQLKPLRAFVESQPGWRLVKEYVEKESAFQENSDRKRFKAMFEDARTQKFNLLLVWSFDRFSRGGTFKTIPLLNRLRSYGVEFKSLTEPFLDSTSETFEFLVPFMSWMAKRESKNRSDRMKAQIAFKKGKNIPVGRATQSARMTNQGIPGKILELKRQNPELSVRKIAQRMRYRCSSGKLKGVSVGYVHLTLKKSGALDGQKTQ